MDGKKYDQGYRYDLEKKKTMGKEKGMYENKRKFKWRHEVLLSDLDFVIKLERKEVTERSGKIKNIRGQIGDMRGKKRL